MKTIALYVRWIAPILCILCSTGYSLMEGGATKDFLSARSASMGGVAAASSQGTQSIFSNPARLIHEPQNKFKLLEINVESAPSLLKSYEILSKTHDYPGLIGRPISVGLQTVIGEYTQSVNETRNLTFSIGLFSKTLLIGQIHDTSDPTTYALTQIGPSIGVAYRLLRKNPLSIGFSIRSGGTFFNQETLDLENFLSQENYLKDILNQNLDNIMLFGALDLGVDFKFYQHKDVSFSVAGSLKNLALLSQKIKQNGKMTITTPVIGTAGILFQKNRFGLMKNFSATLDWVLLAEFPEESLLKKINFGFEAYLYAIAIRAGFHQGYPTAGIGLKAGILELQAFTYAQELGTTTGQNEYRSFGLEISSYF